MGYPVRQGFGWKRIVDYPDKPNGTRPTPRPPGLVGPGGYWDWSGCGNGKRVGRGIPACSSVTCDRQSARKTRSSGNPAQAKRSVRSCGAAGRSSASASAKAGPDASFPDTSSSCRVRAAGRSAPIRLASAALGMAQKGTRMVRSGQSASFGRSSSSDLQSRLTMLSPSVLSVLFNTYGPRAAERRVRSGGPRKPAQPVVGQVERLQGQSRVVSCHKPDLRTLLPPLHSGRWCACRGARAHPHSRAGMLCMLASIG